MNARAVTGFAVVLLATLMAAAPVAFGQVIRITAPSPNQHFPLGYDDDGAFVTGDVTISYTATLPGGVTGELHVYVDDEPMYAVPISGSVLLSGLDAGAHTVMLWLADDGGNEYAFAPSGQGTNPQQDLTPPAAAIRFYVSRVCYTGADCLDSDPCTKQDCIGELNVGGGWYGHCRFGRDVADDNCCVTESWCLFEGLFQADGSGLICGQNDGDGIGDCVECIVDADCPTEHSACVESATCVAGVCDYVINGCCGDGDCDDGDRCTRDYCCAGPGNPVPECTAALACANVEIPLNPGEAPCCNTTADCDDGDPCTTDGCIGGRCAYGTPVRDCCDEDQDCDRAGELNLCNNPGGRGYATCGDIDPVSGLGLCDYDFAPGCCIHNYHCGDRFPQEIGTCVANQCQYVVNTEYCESPVDTLVINEFMVNPVGNEEYPLPDVLGEWFELFNPTDTDININGWTFEDLGSGGAGQFVTIDDPDGMVRVPAGGYAVIVRDPLTNGGVEWDYAHPDSNFMLDNDEDEIILRNALGEIQDEVAYDASWEIREGVAFALINPYLDNALQTSWAHAKQGYPFGYVWDAAGNPMNLGSPRFVNNDVFNTALNPGGTCDDGNPCTIDICNHDKASLCSHIVIEDCCVAADDRACNDYNVCTVDSCNLATNECLHERIPDCCVIDSDCDAWYPAWVLPGEQGDFDSCATKACIGSTCRYGRLPQRPGCCISGDHQYFGCEDRNLCTVDACVQDAGVDPLGSTYAACIFNLDLDGDGINECCRADGECEDNDPVTLDYCNLNFNVGPMNTCQYPPDPDYCGPGGNTSCDDGDICTDDVCCDGVDSPVEGCEGEFRCLHIPVEDCCTVNTDCIDGQACTQDLCCTGVGEPHASCLRANVCVHPEVASGCCTAHSDCRVPETNPFFPCRTGYCIGSVCRFGPQVDGCCLTAADCNAGICDDVVCDANNDCQFTPRPGCCETGADCDQAEAPGPCDANVCISNQCTVIAIPNCCEDDNPAGPDASCDDGNPCTADYCTEVSGNNQCRYFPTGGVGCCNADSMCPDDNVKCTRESCDMGVNRCQLDPVAECRATLVYAMSFTEGHSAYAGEYETLADLAWTVVDIGTGQGRPFVGFGSTGELGPDKYLSFLPTATVTSFETCAVTPKLRTVGISRATVGFDFAANWSANTVGIRVRGSVNGNWQSAPVLTGGSLDISQDVPAKHYNLDIAQLLLGSDDTQIAFCFTGASTDDLVELMFDQIVVSQGRPPIWQQVNTANVLAPRAVAAGGNATFPAAFQIREFDTDESVSFQFVSPPGSWLRIANVARVVGDPTLVRADFEVVGAVCPPVGDTYNLTVRASDGALYDFAYQELEITGCP